MQDEKLETLFFLYRKLKDTTGTTILSVLDKIILELQETQNLPPKGLRGYKWEIQGRKVAIECDFGPGMTYKYTIPLSFMWLPETRMRRLRLVGFHKKLHYQEDIKQARVEERNRKLEQIKRWLKQDPDLADEIFWVLKVGQENEHESGMV